MLLGVIEDIAINKSLVPDGLQQNQKQDIQ